MATVAPTIVERESRTTLVTWVLGPGDDGEPVRYVGAVERTVQIFGTFGGATVALQGTIEDVPSTWMPLTDVQGNAISATSNTLETITEMVRHTRPKVTGGSASAITVLLLMRATI